jgi:hypothetical protein
MSVQYIADSAGNTTGVFIPINEWNAIKDKYKETGLDIGDDNPGWHPQILHQRMDDYRNDGIMLEWDDVIRDLEKDF